jgi:hypothetical protein
MVMRRLCAILAVLVTAIGLEAAPAVLDFSRSHTMEDVRRSGLRFKRLSDFGHSVAYVYEEDRDIVVLLPGGRKISQRITIAHLFEKDGVLTRLALHSGVMPQDQAYQVAGTFCDSFNLSHDKLEAWYQLNFGKKYDNEPLNINADDKYYPAVDLELFPSFSTTYPWSIRFHIQWNWTEHRGKDEEQTWREFPTPAMPEISLNPPSGLRYDRADDFKPYIESLEANFRQSKKAKSQAQGAGVVAASPGTHGWLWVFGFASLTLLALLWFIIRKFGSKR